MLPVSGSDITCRFPDLDGDDDEMMPVSGTCRSPDLTMHELSGSDNLPVLMMT